MKNQIVFESQKELKDHEELIITNMFNHLRYLNYDIPMYSKFVPYKHRQETQWMYCDRCKKGLGSDTSLGTWVWCPNCNMGTEDGGIDESYPPNRLCSGCVNANIRSDEYKEWKGGNLLLDGRRIDYFIPLTQKEIDKWMPYFRTMDMPYELFGGKVNVV